MNMGTFSFTVVDNKLPEDVIADKLKEVGSVTNNYVSAKISPYDGQIKSYEKKVGGNFDSLIEGLTASQETIYVDIQDDLGEQGVKIAKFEVYLTVKGLDNYKYRIMFVYHSAISYPVSIVLSHEIARALLKNQYSFEVNTMRELEDLIDKILLSPYLNKLIQNLINESIRIENRNN